MLVSVCVSVSVSRPKPDDADENGINNEYQLDSTCC